MPESKLVKLPASVLVVILVALYVLAFPALAATKKSEATTVADLDKLLRWLPADCETLVVYRKPFSIQAISKSQGLPEDFADAFRCHLVRLPLPMEQNQIIPKSFMDGKKILLQVSAGRFRPGPSEKERAPLFITGDPESLPPEELSIIVLDNDESLQDALVLARQSAEKVYPDQGYEVIVLREYNNLLTDAWPCQFYFCSPAIGVLLCASDREIMHEVLLRIADAKPKGRGHLEIAKRLLPAELPEWKLLDEQADIWAVRHRVKCSVAIDRSSPDYLTAKDKSAHRDQKPEGLVFEYSQSQGQAKISFISDDFRVRELRKTTWNSSSEHLPVYKTSESGPILTFTFDVAQSVTGKRWELALAVWHLLGYI